MAVADVAAPDGHGGIRLMGRAADRIGAVIVIPASDVGSELLKNPGAEGVASSVIRAKMTKSWRAR